MFIGFESIENKTVGSRWLTKLRELETTTEVAKQKYTILRL